MNRIKLNPRQLWVHFIAFWLFIGSFRYLAYLTNIRLFKVLIAPGDPGHYFDRYKAAKIDVIEYSSYLTMMSSSLFFSVMFALAISLLMSWRKRWSWINSVLVAVLSVFLYGATPRSWRGPVWHTPIYYDLFPRTIGWYLAAGILFLVLGLVLFLSPGINHYIDGGVQKK